MPRNKRKKSKASRAAIKGWETRRKRNPERWGKKALSAAAKKIRELEKKLKVANQKLKRSRKTLKIIKKKVKGAPKRFTDTENLADGIRQAKEAGLEVDQIYLKLAEIFQETPREVYSLWMSPEVA
jgi:hypothetical protein